MAGAKRGLHRLDSDAAAGANNKKFGHWTLNAPQIFSITAAFEKADVRRADVRLEICTVEELYPFIENG
jgi:hypothetical protein